MTLPSYPSSISVSQINNELGYQSNRQSNLSKDSFKETSAAFGRSTNFRLSDFYGRTADKQYIVYFDNYVPNVVNSYDPSGLSYDGSGVVYSVGSLNSYVLNSSYSFITRTTANTGAIVFNKYVYAESGLLLNDVYADGDGYAYAVGTVRDSNGFQSGIMIKFNNNLEVVSAKKIYHSSNADTTLLKVVGYPGDSSRLIVFGWAYHEYFAGTYPFRFGSYWNVLTRSDLGFGSARIFYNSFDSQKSTWPMAFDAKDGAIYALHKYGNNPDSGGNFPSTYQVLATKTDISSASTTWTALFDVNGASLSPYVDLGHSCEYQGGRVFVGAKLHNGFNPSHSLLSSLSSTDGSVFWQKSGSNHRINVCDPNTEDSSVLVASGTHVDGDSRFAITGINKSDGSVTFVNTTNPTIFAISSINIPIQATTDGSGSVYATFFGVGGGVNGNARLASVQKLPFRTTYGGTRTGLYEVTTSSYGTITHGWIARSPIISTSGFSVTTLSGMQSGGYITYVPLNYSSISPTVGDITTSYNVNFF
jgi:hypothetical protein